MPTNPTSKELTSILSDVKRFGNLKLDSWSSRDHVRVLWWALPQGLVKNTSAGYELTEDGKDFLTSNLDFNSWSLKKNRYNLSSKLNVFTAILLVAATYFIFNSLLKTKSEDKY